MKSAIYVILIFNLCLLFSSCEKNENGVSIYMDGLVDSIEFKTTVDYFIHKEMSFDLPKLGYSKIDTIDCVSFNEGCYIDIIVDTTEISPIIFDTGSGTCIFNENTINYHKKGENRYTENIWGELVPISEVYVDRLKLGNSLIIPNNVAFAGHGNIKNLIGGNLLKHFIWKIDNTKKKIFFTRDPSAFSYTSCTALPFSLDHDRPVIRCTVDNLIYDLVLDTGYQGFLNLSGRPYNNIYVQPRDTFKNVKSFSYDSTKIYTYGINEKSINEFFTLSDVGIGTLTLSNELVSHNLAKFNLLGWSFFQRFEFVILDYINQKVYFGPLSDCKTISYLRDIRLYVNTIGIGTTFLPPFIINSLSCSATEMGLSLGDSIVAIDKKPPTPLEMRKVILSKETAVITTKKGGVFTDYKLKRQHHVEEPDTVMSYGEISLLPLYRNMTIEGISKHPKPPTEYTFKYFNWNPPYLAGDTWKLPY